MLYEVLATEQAQRELAALLRRVARWASQTMGMREGMAYVRRLGEAFKTARDDVAERPLRYPCLSDAVLADLGYRRFLVERTLACVFRVQGNAVVVMHVFDARSDDFDELRGHGAEGHG